MKLLWPMIILLSALAAGLVMFVSPDVGVGRPLILLWFVCICPGMMLIRIFQLQEPMTEWALALALSLAIDAAIAGIQLYTGHWSPSITVVILICICVIGAFAQIIATTIKRT